MSAHDDLDLRLREGLRAAAEALPPSDRGGLPPASELRPHGRPPGRPSGRRVALAGAAAVLVAVAATVGVAAVAGDGDDAPDTQVAQAPTTTVPPTTGTVPGRGPAVDPVPGSAVVVGTELVSFGPDGQPGERLSLAPLTDVQSVVSDRHGGWIACGSGAAPVDPTPPGTAGDITATTAAPAIGDVGAPTTTVPAGGPGAPTTTVPASGDPGAPTTTVPSGPASPTTTIPADQGAVERSDGRIATPAPQGATDGHLDAAPPNTYRFRPGQEPEPLPVYVTCGADSLGVTEVDGHQMLTYVAPPDFRITQLDLQTGEERVVDIGTTPLPGQAAVGGGRLAVFDDTGLALWDLATVQQITVGPVDLPVRAPDATDGLLTTDLALSPDGTRLAALVGDISSSSDVVVVDLASGEELFRHEVPVSLEGAEIAFDGTTVAVGNYYDSYGPVRIYDIATGAERTVEAHGLLP